MVVPLQLSPKLELRALLSSVLWDDDMIDTASCTFEGLFDAKAADLEDTESEPESDREVDGPAIVLDFVPPKGIRRGTSA